MTKFHSDDYIDLIKNVTPENKHLYSDQLYRCNFKKYYLIFIDKNFFFIYYLIFKDNFGDDCPIIDRLYEYCCTYTSAEIVAAKMLN